MEAEKSKNTEKAPIFTNKDLKALIIPLILEQFLAISLGMIDTIMVAGIGEASVSGVSLVDMVNVLIINIFAALATGGAVVSSHFLGARDENNARNSAVQIMIVSLVSSLFIMICVMIGGRGLLSLLFGKIEADVMDSAVTYLWITAISYPFIAIYNGCAALFRSMGNSKISMYSSLVVNIVNIGLNALLIYGFEMGVAGAAIATVTARGIAMLYLMYRLTDKNHTIYIDWRRPPIPNWQIIKKILYIGIPGSLENSIFQLGRVLVVSIISVFGTVQIAANAVANNLDSLGCIPGQAMSLAILSVVGRCVGANDYPAAEMYTKKLMKITYIASFVVNMSIILTLQWSLKLYDLSPETLSLATILIIIHNGCAIILWPVAFALPNTMRAAGDVKFTMIVSIASMWVFRILFSWILGSIFKWGAIGVWCAMVMDWICRDIFFLWRYFSKKWQRKSIVTES